MNVILIIGSGYIGGGSCTTRTYRVITLAIPTVSPISSLYLCITIGATAAAAARPADASPATAATVRGLKGTLSGVLTSSSVCIISQTTGAAQTAWCTTATSSATVIVVPSSGSTATSPPEYPRIIIHVYRAYICSYDPKIPSLSGVAALLYIQATALTAITTTGLYPS